MKVIIYNNNYEKEKTYYNVNHVNFVSNKTIINYDNDIEDTLIKDFDYTYLHIYNF